MVQKHELSTQDIRAIYFPETTLNFFPLTDPDVTHQKRAYCFRCPGALSVIEQIIAGSKERVIPVSKQKQLQHESVFAKILQDARLTFPNKRLTFDFVIINEMHNRRMILLISDVN